MHELEEGLPGGSAAGGIVLDLHLASDAQKRAASGTRAVEHLAPQVLSRFQDSKYQKLFEQCQSWKSTLQARVLRSQSLRACNRLVQGFLLLSCSRTGREQSWTEPLPKAADDKPWSGNSADVLSPPSQQHGVHCRVCAQVSLWCLP